MNIKITFKNGEVKSYECTSYKELIPAILKDGYKSDDLEKMECEE